MIPASPWPPTCSLAGEPVVRGTRISVEFGDRPPGRRVERSRRPAELYWSYARRRHRLPCLRPGCAEFGEVFRARLRCAFWPTNVPGRRSPRSGAQRRRRDAPGPTDHVGGAQARIRHLRQGLGELEHRPGHAASFCCVSMPGAAEVGRRLVERPARAPAACALPAAGRLCGAVRRDHSRDGRLWSLFRRRGLMEVRRILTDKQGSSGLCRGKAPPAFCLREGISRLGSRNGASSTVRRLTSCSFPVRGGVVRA